jgi:hypothetical protein
VHKGGEDACYSDKYMLIVADGVGGWAKVVWGLILIISMGLTLGYIAKNW